MTRLSDAEAKAIMRNSSHWPARTSTWGVPRANTYWLRARPNDNGDTGTLPRLSVPGASLFTTQPDGLWVYLMATADDSDFEYADIIAVEVCGTMQNLHDKRSRFLASGSSVILRIPVTWLRGEMAVAGGGRSSRISAAGWADLDDQVPQQGEVRLPVRFARVVFALPNELYADWRSNGVPAGHEYYMRHSSLRTMTGQAGQAFLSRMSFGSHFLTGGNG
ncbi:MAG: hypothetical protein ACIAQ0_07035 [Phycisphaerales bacterium JB058]